jgi:hypothetical protein
MVLRLILPFIIEIEDQQPLRGVGPRSEIRRLGRSLHRQRSGYLRHEWAEHQYLDINVIEFYRMALASLESKRSR